MAKISPRPQKNGIKWLSMTIKGNDGIIHQPPAAKKPETFIGACILYINCHIIFS